MIELIADFLPVAIGMALSPLPLIAVMLILTSSDGPGGSIGFAIGRVSAAIMLVVVATELGSLVSDGGESSTASAWIHVVVGVALIALAGTKTSKQLSSDGPPELPSWMSGLEGISFGKGATTGFVLTAINPKELAFSISAGLLIGSADASLQQHIGAVIAFVLISTSSVVLPVIGALVAEGWMRPKLNALDGWLKKNFPIIIALVLFLIGVSVLSSGLKAL